MGIVYACAVPHPPLIVPAVGRGEEKKIQATIDAYHQIAREVLAAKPDVIVVTSPHAPYFRNVFHITTDAMLWGSMAQFRVPVCCIEARCDITFARTLVSELRKNDIPAATSDDYRDDMDHATLVPLYFVREAYREAAGEDGQLGVDLPCPIVRIGLSMLPAETHRELGRIIAHVANEQGKRVAFIASGDLSHKLKADGPYGYVPEGPAFDAQICELFAAGDLDGLFMMDANLCEAASECGLRSFQIMAGALEGLDVDAELLSHEGTFGVGYGVAAFRIADLPSCECEPSWPVQDAAPDEQEPEVSEDVDPHIALARLSVETYVRTGRAAQLPADVPQELLNTQAGAFVSLHEHGQLRGCIGTIAPTRENVAQEILQNGISACSRDPRFDSVTEDELDYLEYSVDVLAPAEPIESTDQLDPVRYGVIVTKGWRRGLLLPNLEGVDTVDEQVFIAKRKAGISPLDTNVQLERFEVVRYTRGGEPRIP
ncbi:MAG: AmmeMemoRadiSam system protein A [Eggerthellaceae bacterium]|nr:AmmeMemoRadiSam system protein A [Eggerthellaceae bacterium]